ncbi:hypothetical protein A9R05_43065 (plasmid) [Burkholderia sp. KK1]|nr:hypothetical protein A9R05_43065 [Burkholderia sp. KK1]
MYGFLFVIPLLYCQPSQESFMTQIPSSMLRSDRSPAFRARVDDIIAKSTRIYDNNGKTADRYTVLYMLEPERSGLYAGRGMNDEPYHPMGIGMCISGAPGRHLGRKITFDDLPEDCRRVVISDVASYVEATLDDLPEQKGLLQ